MGCPEIYLRIASKLQLEGCRDRANGHLGSLEKHTPIEILKPWLVEQFVEINYTLSPGQLNAIATRFPALDYDKGEYGTAEDYTVSYFSELNLIAAILWWAVPELAGHKLD